MNFLAHLYLSYDDEDLLIGNFIADFIRNKDLHKYSPEIQKGVFLHRQIDTFTDNHPQVRKGTRRLHPQHHKYAPVVIDILYDHLLANNWSKYSNQSLDQFANDTYKILSNRIEELPLILQNRLPGMISGKWLQSYKTKEGLLYTLERMDKRAVFPSRFFTAVDQLEENYELFNNEFNLFFPDVIRFAKTYFNLQSEEKL